MLIDQCQKHADSDSLITYDCSYVSVFIQSTPTQSNALFHQRVGIRKRYSQTAMTSAIHAVRANKMKKSEASRHFGVPLSTLLDKLSGRSPEFT